MQNQYLLHKLITGLFKHYLQETRIPLNVMWRLTDRCNSECDYCYIRNQSRKELDTDQVLHIVDELHSLGVFRIGLVGGEVFIREDIEKIVDHILKKNILLTIVSNGSFVPEYENIVKKINCLVLSFDGAKKSHERGRQKGSFNKLMTAFDYCRNEQINVLTITVLNRYNLNDLDFIINTVSEYGFKCNFHLLQAGPEHYPANEEYRTSIDRLITRKKAGAPIVCSLKTLKMLRNWDNYSYFVSNEPNGNYKCLAGELVFNIDTDGSMSACDIRSYNEEQKPNVVRHGVKEAIERVSRNDCHACTCVPVIEYSNLFALSPSTIINWLRLVYKI